MNLNTLPVTAALPATDAISQLKCVTAIGGGHGLGRVLSTLSFLERRLIGIVATTDDGGASGLLRRNHDCIAWGDIRNCLTQLAQQPLAADVLNFRFDSNHELKGHNLGNLILYTLDKISARPLESIQLLSRFLNINTRILPMSETPVDLVASTHEGLECFGELHVDRLLKMPRKLTLSHHVTPPPEALNHLRRSDLIILGPGSFLTSIMPPLLVANFAQAIKESKAPVLFIDNLVPEHSPAGELSLAERLQWMRDLLQLDLVDAAISQSPQPQLEIPVFLYQANNLSTPHHHDPEALLASINAAVSHFY